MYTNPVKVYFANITECEQDGTIANIHNWAGVYFQVTFSLPLPSSLLKFPSNTSYHCCCKWNIVYERWYQSRNPYNKDHCDAQFTLIRKWRKMWYVRGLKDKTKQNLSVNHVRKKLMTRWSSSSIPPGLTSHCLKFLCLKPYSECQSFLFISAKQWERGAKRPGQRNNYWSNEPATYFPRNNMKTEPFRNFMSLES